MAGIVVGGVCHYSLEGTVNGRPFSVVVDMDIDTEAGADRNAAILDQAKVLNGNTVQHFMPHTGNGAILQRCRWVDYDNEAGDTGETALATEGQTLPASGSIAGDVLPGNAAFLIHKAVAGGRAARSGRMYWPGPAESSATANAVASGELAGWQLSLTAWLDEINQENAVIPPGGSNYSSRLVVIHQVSTLAPTFTAVTGLTMDPVLATQRRRLRG